MFKAIKKNIYKSDRPSLTPICFCFPLSVEDEVELRVSEDEGAVEVEDASTQPAPHLRPPMFNPEDYALGLTKYSRMSNLYPTEAPRERKVRGV